MIVYMIKIFIYLLEKILLSICIYDKGYMKVNNIYNYVFVFFIYRDIVIYYNVNL